MSMYHERSNNLGGFITSLAFFLFSVFLVFGVLFFYKPSSSPALAAKVSKTQKKVRLPGALLVPEISNATFNERKSHHVESITKTEETVKPLAKEIELDEMAQREDLERAMALVDGGKIKEALPLLEEILRKEPNNEMALIEMGMIYMIDLKAPEKAVGYLEQALKVNPSNQVVASELTEIFATSKMGEEGISFFKGLYEQNPNNSTVASGLGKMLSGEKRYQEAIPYLESAVSQGGGAMLRGDLAAAYGRSGQSDKAIAEYQRAIAYEEQRVNPEHHDGEFGMAPEMAQDSKEVIATMKLALAQEYFKSGRENEAKELVEGVKKLVGDGIARIYQDNKDRIFE